METVFNENAIDIIIHCATDYGRTENNPLSVVDANLIFPLKLLEQSKKNHIKCFINTDTVLDKRIDNYSLSKKQFKEWLYTYRKIFSCVNVALEHFYGPGDNPNKFVTYILHNLIKNVDMIDLTKGEQKRDFIYIDDVVDAFAKIIKSSDDFFENFYEFEIGSSQSLSIREFVELAKKISGNTGTVLNFGAIPYRENEIMSHQADTTGISGLGWKCTISPAEGLRKMFESEKRLINQISHENINHSWLRFLGWDIARKVLARGDEFFIFDNLSRVGSEKNLEWLKDKGNFRFIHSDIRDKNTVADVIKNVKGCHFH